MRPVYMHRLGYPTSMIFVPSKEAFERFLKDHDIRKEFPSRGFVYPTSRGHTTYIETPSDNRYILVFLGDKLEHMPPINAMGVIAHEVQHMLQYLWMSIGEDTRGHEQEAYAAQHFFCQLSQSFMLTRRPKWGFKVSDTEAY